MQTPGAEGSRSLPPALPIVRHGTPPPEGSAKRQRLTLACNACRKRKVKCDSEMPKCRNCRIRGDICETTDPKHPELVVVRKYGAAEGDFRESSYGNDTDYTPTSNLQHGPAIQRSTTGEQPVSWVARSYEAHRNLGARSPMQRDGVVSSFNDQISTRASLNEPQESPEMALNTDSGHGRQKVMGGSSLQSLSMFLDLYLQGAGFTKISSCFRHGMGFVEEFVLPLSLSLPDLPPESLTDRYVSSYVRSIHPLYPILDPESLSTEIQKVRSYQDASWSPSGGFSGLR